MFQMILLVLNSTGLDWKVNKQKVKGQQIQHNQLKKHDN